MRITKVEFDTGFTLAIGEIVVWGDPVSGRHEGEVIRLTTEGPEVRESHTCWMLRYPNIQAKKIDVVVEKKVEEKLPFDIGDTVLTSFPTVTNHEFRVLVRVMDIHPVSRRVSVKTLAGSPFLIRYEDVKGKIMVIGSLGESMTIQEISIS
jgi:hypothetical protein